MNRAPALTGALLALAAAALFGATAPLIQRLGAGIGAWSTACLLYAGAAAAAALFRKGAHREAPLRARQLPRLAAVAAFGAVLAPVLLAWGLQRPSGLAASLMLALEALFTFALARLLYREHLDRRVMTAMALLIAGGALLLIDRASAGASQILGLLAVAGATLAWAADNTLSRALADTDPGSVVLGKGSLGALFSGTVALLLAEPLPGGAVVLGLLACGAFGYGLSLRFYLLAQRSFGAARTGSVFAAAPFVGAAVAIALGERSLSLWLAGGFVLMACGVALHAIERHTHPHRHKAIDHEHAHHHDDGHHLHVHDSLPGGMHSHPHHHEATEHAHPHVPDLHHAHTHDA